jgi:hypothetical protein
MSVFDLLKNKSKKSTRQFIGAASIEDGCLVTYSGEKLAFLIITPVNLSILSPEDVRSRIKKYTSLLDPLGTSDYICINSTQSYESNKHYLASLAEEELNDTLKELDEKDIDYLDDIRVKMATSRQFLVMLRFTAKDKMEYVAGTLTKALQLMKDNEFTARAAYRDDLKQYLAVYLEQCIFQDRFQDFDGENCTNILEMKS